VNVRPAEQQPQGPVRPVGDVGDLNSGRPGHEGRAGCAALTQDGVGHAGPGHRSGVGTEAVEVVPHRFEPGEVAGCRPRPRSPLALDDHRIEGGDRVGRGGDGEAGGGEGQWGRVRPCDRRPDEHVVAEALQAGDDPPVKVAEKVEADAVRRLRDSGLDGDGW
jgi:hypothetical protein